LSSLTNKYANVTLPSAGKHFQSIFIAARM
jgi:hypothetical protein